MDSVVDSNTIDLSSNEVKPGSGKFDLQRQLNLIPVPPTPSDQKASSNTVIATQRTVDELSKCVKQLFKSVFLNIKISSKQEISYNRTKTELSRQQTKSQNIQVKNIV